MVDVADHDREIDDEKERHFNVRAAVPDHQAVFVRWRRWSDEAKATSRHAQLDVAYGDRPTQTLDIFPPMLATRSAAPAIMLIHGGYWQAMSKDDVSFAARGLNALGIAVVCVNYSLCPNVGLGDIVDEMRDASLWIYKNASRLGIDAARLVVGGHSAGGHLAAMMATEDWSTLDPAAPVDLYKGCLCISGLFDLEDLVETSINIKVGLDRVVARTLSPIYRRPRQGLAVLAVVGGAESEGFHEQSRRLSIKWGTFGADVALSIEDDDCNHFQVFERLRDADDPMCRTVAGWVR